MDQNLSLGRLLDHAVVDSDNARIEVREILESFGNRAFGPALFLFALIELLPFISAIPGMYIVTGSALILLSGQILLGREKPWLPAWLLNRSLSRKSLRNSLTRWRAWVTWLETLIRPRWTFLVERPFLQLIALNCIVFAAAFFPLAPIPASEKLLAIPVAFFALAIIARDGLLVVLGFLVTGALIGVLICFWPSMLRLGSTFFESFGF